MRHPPPKEHGTTIKGAKKEPKRQRSPDQRGLRGVPCYHPDLHRSRFQHNLDLPLRMTPYKPIKHRQKRSHVYCMPQNLLTVDGGNLALAYTFTLQELTGARVPPSTVAQSGPNPLQVLIASHLSYSRNSLKGVI